MKFVPAYILALIFALFTGAAFARSAEMRDPQPISLFDRAGASLDANATRGAIITGAGRKHWTVQSESPGRIELRTEIRNKHTIVVTAAYSAGQVRFEYASSVNMNYRARPGKPALIHPSYMVWRSQLENSVLDAAAGR